jgi:hypothetical protein
VPLWLPACSTTRRPCRQSHADTWPSPRSLPPALSGAPPLVQTMTRMRSSKAQLLTPASEATPPTSGAADGFGMETLKSGAGESPLVLLCSCWHRRWKVAFGEKGKGASAAGSVGSADNTCVSPSTHNTRDCPACPHV